MGTAREEPTGAGVHLCSQSEAQSLRPAFCRWRERTLQWYACSQCLSLRIRARFCLGSGVDRDSRETAISTERDRAPARLRPKETRWRITVPSTSSTECVFAQATPDGSRRLNVLTPAARSHLLVSPGGVPMYIARYEHFLVKRLPDTGHQHHPDVPVVRTAAEPVRPGRGTRRSGHRARAGSSRGAARLPADSADRPAR